jgi:hypothetical protein
MEVNVKQSGESKYAIKLTNFDGMKLPLEVLADGKITKIMVDKTAITVESKTMPQIDPKGFYLKRVVME